MSKNTAKQLIIKNKFITKLKKAVSVKQSIREQPEKTKISQIMRKKVVKLPEKVIKV